MIYTLIRTFTNVSRQLFKSMHFMHRWWSSSEACKAPLWRQRESSVYCMSSHFPASYLSIQIITSPSQELLTCFTSLHLSQTEAPQLWMSETTHTITCTSLQTIPIISISYQAIVIPKCFFPVLQTSQWCSLQTLNITTPFSLRNVFSPMLPQYITDFFLLVYNNLMVHWTNTKLDSHYTSFYSCHHIECNTVQMHIANEY